jgi:hypothetical protein
MLANTFEQIRGADLAVLTGMLSVIDGGQATYVGSGGALSVARLAAELHEVRATTLARAATPLELIGMPPPANSAVVIFSAGARHPDASAASTAALRSGADPVVLVTHRDPDDLAGSFSDDVTIVRVPGPRGREGFLATNSVMAMSAALVVASGFALPPRLPNLAKAIPETLRAQTLILGGPGLGAVAGDLETRLSETGLSAAQLTDYRNFAHGRHTGLARHLEQTTIVALIAPSIADLAVRTLDLLPHDAHVVRLETDLPWPSAELDLLAASMRLISPSAAAGELDPARPRVPEFGRKLYHLSSRGLIGPPLAPADRKLAALGIGGSTDLRSRYEGARDAWVKEFREQRFAGFVFDYDGTVCSTRARFDIPDKKVQVEIVRLAEEGAVIGFASGRGGSIHRDLRRWMPRQLWEQVELGLYNGGLLMSLDQQMPDASRPSGPIDEAVRRILRSPLPDLGSHSERSYQLALTPAPGSGVNLEVLAQIAREAVAMPPALPLKVGVSGHSIDVVPADSTKTNASARVRARAGGQVLAFGDQGQLGGNDFELLAESRWSLSVDRVSGDPTRCWNLDTRGERGPELLRRYLRSLRRLRGGFAFRPAR